MTTPIAVDREQVLAYRAAAQGLHRESPTPGADVTALRVLDIGVQNTPPGSARLALAARLPVVPDDTVSDRWDAPGGPLAMAWGLRGSPHLYREADLRWLAAAMWPRGDADAGARIASVKTRGAREAGISPLAALRATVDAYVEVFDGPDAQPMTKGEASGAVSALLPDVLTPWCESCQAHHLSDLLFTQAALPAGIRLRRQGSTLLLSRLPGWQVPDRQAGTDRLVTAYLDLVGPATLADVAGFLGTSQAEARQLLPAGLVEVTVEGATAWLPQTRLDALRSAPPPPRVRLLPASDPYLQTRNRSLLVEDPARHKQVWKALNQPGALLVDGEVRGVWRARAAGRTRLDLHVTPFTPLPAPVRQAVDEEAERLATARGARSARVHEQTG